MSGVKAMLQGKNALITGSTSGIGLSIATCFARSGMNVMLNGLGDAAEIEEIRQGLVDRFGIRALYSNADMTKPAQIQAMIVEALDQFGRIDVLVNNAGIQYVAPIEDFPVEKWDAIIAINLSSAFHTIQGVLPGMKQQYWGRIINIASAHSLVASPFKSAYVAAKHGLLGLTKTVALESAQDVVTVNAICPVYVLTKLVADQIPATARARGMTEDEVKRDVLLAAQPSRQFVSTEQLAELAVFLCSDAASSITGAALPVDGGWTAQ